MFVRRYAPYGIAVAGALAVTALIGVVDRYWPVAGLSSIYLLVVLWLGATWGRWPAVTASVCAFLLYDFFFVPPVGTFTVRGPSELLELVVLLAVALVTGQLASSLRRAHAASEATASESRALYELATAALRSSEVTSALSLLCRRATTIRGVKQFSLVGMDFGQPVALAGGELGPADLKQAAWAYENGRAVGVSVSEGTIRVMRMRPQSTGPAHVPLASGVAVIGFGDEHLESDDLRMIAALVGLAGLLLDRRRAALESERARGLEVSDRLKAAVLSSLSHELKSPIASLRAGLTALVSPRAGLGAEQTELLQDLDRQASRLDHMVGDMLTLSRLEAGVALDREPHRFADLVGTALRELRSDLKGRRVDVSFADGLPPVEVDEVQAGRLLFNLLENALEWAPGDGAISVGAAVRDGHLEGWVENEGPAIAPNDLDRIFDTFWTRRARGSGLGLAICKRVVEAHGGTIRAENLRRGPRFTFTLPLAHVHA